MARSFDNSNRPSKLTHSIYDYCDFPTYKIQYWYTCSLSLHRCPSAPNPPLESGVYSPFLVSCFILCSRPVPAPDWAHAEKEEIPVGLSLSGRFWPQKGRYSQDRQYGNPLLAGRDSTATPSWRCVTVRQPPSWRCVTVRQPPLGGEWQYGNPL